MQKSIQETKLHDHTCLIFKNELEFFHCAIPFIIEGLKNNEKCYLIIDDILRESVLKNFKYLYRNGQNPFNEKGFKEKVVIEDFKNIYLKKGFFEGEAALGSYIDILEKTKSEGFNGLRVFAELSTSMRKINTEDFLMYEEDADKHFEDNNFLAVCAYNEKYFSREYLLKVRKTHPVEINLLRTRF